MKQEQIVLSGVGIIQAFPPQMGKALSFLWEHLWGHWEQAIVISENQYSSNHFSSRAPERVEMDFPSKILGKGNNKDDPKDSTDFPVNPSKSPCIQTRAPCPARRATPQTVQPTFAFLYHTPDTSREQNQRTDCINSCLLPLAISHPSRTT